MRIIQNVVAYMCLAVLLVGCAPTIAPNFYIGYNREVSNTPTIPAASEVNLGRERTRQPASAPVTVPSIADPRAERVRGLEEAARERGIPYRNPN